MSFVIEINAASGKAPDWIELVPSGEFSGRDGRAWLNDQPERIVKRFNQNAQPLILDWEHASEHKAPQGDPTPAAGWIEDMEVRKGSVWGRVDWTERGRETVANREYRFISPVLVYQKPSRRVVDLASVGLVGRPNLHLKALNRAEISPEKNKENNIMDLGKVYLALDLTDGANEEQILKAINRLKADYEKALNSADSPDLDKFVPRADFDKLKSKANEFEKALNTFKDDALSKEIETAIGKALEDGKIVPASADYHKAQCRTEGGLERFQDFVKSAPVIAGASGLEDKALNKKESISDEDRWVAEQLGRDINGSDKRENK